VRLRSALRPVLPAPAPVREVWPSVGVVITTRARPHLVRRAIDSISEQDYPGAVRIVVVVDQAHPDWRLARGGVRPVLVLENWRTPGLAGARNSGIQAVDDCELVALCADADTWTPEKLTAQVEALRANPGAVFVTCAAEVEYDGRRTPRLLGLDMIDAHDMARKGCARLSPSGFLASQQTLRTSPLRGGIGSLAENAPPASQDWDLLMRAARRTPVVHVDTPLVRLLWRRPDGDTAAFIEQSRALRWMLPRHPELAASRTAAAHVYGEIARWEALSGHHSSAWTWAWAAVHARWWQPSAAAGLAAATGLLHGKALQASLRRRLG
jgi:glycosyltransferase involved in cell wall biosynthesis